MDEPITLYQGTKRRYGFFICLGCFKYWQSSWSWANVAQKCRKCKTLVYPYKQVPLSLKINMTLRNMDSP